MRDRMYYSKEAQSRATRERWLIVVVVSLLGIAAGSLVMLLLAPRSGDETRRLISQTVTDAAERSSEATQTAVKQLSEELKELRQRMDNQK